MQDGYGDALSVAERLGQLEVLTRIRASEHAHHLAEPADLAQEARITIWQVATGRPESTREYLSAAARMRVREAATRQTWTGHTRVHGQPADPLRSREKESLDDPDFTLLLSLHAQEWVEGAQLAYHHGQIAQAIGELPEKQRAYVLLRFWCGLEPGVIERDYQIDKDAAWAGARRNLRTSLRHLAAA